jgi:hypothetical protein
MVAATRRPRQTTQVPVTSALAASGGHDGGDSRTPGDDGGRGPKPLGASVASSAPPAGPAELALIAPLVPGGALLDFAVREIRAVDRGRLRVVCVKDKAVVRLDVALLDPEGVLPPASAGRYAVFYSLRGATPEDGERLAHKLARVIEPNAAKGPPPPGMTTFTPDQRPPTEL